MKTASVRQDGYTIVEVMIFLTISATLLLSVIGLFTNRITNTEFNQSVRSLEAVIRSVANEAGTGTFPNTPAFACTIAPGGGPVPQPAAVGDQGTRDKCIFVGKVMNFGTAQTYTAVGRRTVGATGLVSTNLTGANGAMPRVVVDPDISQPFALEYGTEVTGVYRKTTPLTEVSAVGFFQTFNNQYTNNNLGSGSQGVETWTISSSTAPIAPKSLAEIDAAVDNELMTQASEGVLICLRSGSRKASITLGSSNAGTVTTTVLVGDPQCAS